MEWWTITLIITGGLIGLVILIKITTMRKRNNSGGGLMERAVGRLKDLSKCCTKRILGGA